MKIDQANLEKLRELINSIEHYDDAHCTVHVAMLWSLTLATLGFTEKESAAMLDAVKMLRIPQMMRNKQ